jgi:hypothetical protein
MRFEATAVIVGLVVLAGASQGGCTQDPPDRARAHILEVAADTVHVRLVDAVTTRAITNTEVEVSSDSGIRCVQAPCPTNEKRWTGWTDTEGSVMIPIDALQVVTSMRTSAHYADLINDSYAAVDGVWAVDMFPRNAPQELEFHPLDLKLIDARTLAPISDTPVRITLGRTGGFEGTTNSLGYIFVPVEALLGDTADSWPPARDAGPEYGRVIVPGYHTAQTDFSRATRKLLMKRR